MNIRDALTPLAALAMLVAMQGAGAAVVVSGTRIIHDGGSGARDTTVQMRNNGESPAMVQVWLDHGDAQARPGAAAVPFLMTPAEPRLLEPKQRQAYRFTYAPAPGQAPLPADRESLLYLNLLDIPPKPANSEGKSLLQFAVRSRLKYFYRPAGLSGKPRDAVNRLVWRVTQGAQGQMLHVRNPTAYHITFSGVTGKTGEPIELDMVAPFAETTVAVAKGNEVGSSLSFKWIDDYGTSVLADAIVSDH